MEAGSKKSLAEEKISETPETVAKEPPAKKAAKSSNWKLIDLEFDDEAPKAGVADCSLRFCQERRQFKKKKLLKAF